MGTFWYDDQVKFELPWDFEYSTEYDDEGKDSHHIKTGSYYNDDGEKCYKFSCGIGTAEASDDTPVTSLRDMAKNIAEGDGKTRFLMFDENPEIVMFTRGMPMNLFGMSLLYYMLVVSVLVERNHIVNLSVVSTYMEDDEDENLSVFENMATVIRSMSVNGKKNDLQGMDAQALHTALKPCFNEEDNVDLDERLRELLGGSEEDVSCADQPLPDGVCASEDGYAVINDDWAVRLPDGWVFSTEEEYTSGRPLAAISREEYDESGRGPFDYGDNCFIVFRMAETGSNEYGMHGMLAGLMNSNEKTVVDRLGLRVSYSCRHEESSTYCQFVTVTTRRASYMIQLFYTDEYLGEYGRIGKIEEILNTICLAYEVPYSERYQRREHAKPAATPVKTAKKNNIDFSRAYPDESLYPHYNSLLNSPLKSLGFLGVNVVVNSTGTEYAFQSFRSALNSFSTDPDENLSEEQRNRLTRILNKDTASYDLHKKAKAMQSLFHVDPSVFDPKHDRECELEHGLMHRAYMMSALRSFAWTLSAYCKESGETPATVDYSRIRDLIAYIASHNWLNYDGETHCTGLCGGNDLHVYFVPDSTSAEDRRQLRGEGMSEEEEARIREKFENFNIIRSQVRSFDALRRDLAYIYPAIEKIYDALKATRNDREQLLGDEADILYAWCALALAAKEPFFSEDGPMNYWYDQCNNKKHPVITQKVSAAKSQSKAKADRTDYVVEGKTTNAFEIENGILKKYKGTDPEVVIPEEISHIAQRAFQKCASVRQVIIGQQVTSIEGSAFDDCFFLETVEILGDVTELSHTFSKCPRLRHVKLPAALRKLGYYAFEGCKSLQSVELPEGLEVLDLSAFSECSALRELVIPATVRRIDWNKYNKVHLRCKVYAGSPAESLLHVRMQDANFANACEVKVLQAQPPRAFVRSKQETETFQIEGKKLIAYIGQAEQVTIPVEVTEIGKEAFRGNLDLRRVILHNKVTKIEDSAFSGCRFLEEINLPESLRAIGEWAFCDCDGLETIRIPPKVKVIKKWSFRGCARLKEVVFSSGLNKIRWNAFEGCTLLEQVDLPDTLQTIESSAFSDTGIIDLVLPKSLTELERQYRMPCLRSVLIPRSLENLEAFKAYDMDYLLFHVYPDSAAERWCKEEELQFDHNVPMTPEELERMEKIEAERKRKAQEAERRRKAAEEAERKRQAELVAKRTHYDELQKNISEQERIITENRGWFGEHAKVRKAAKEQLAILQAQLTKEFPHGRP